MTLCCDAVSHWQAVWLVLWVALPPKRWHTQSLSLPSLPVLIPPPPPAPLSPELIGQSVLALSTLPSIMLQYLQLEPVCCLQSVLIG